LNDVAQRDDVPESHLLVLGDKGAGKHSLLQSLNKNCVRAKNKFLDVEKMGSHYSALDFQFLYVKDPSEKDLAGMMVSSEDNLPRMNVWTLQDPEKSDLLRMVVKPENLEYTSALIVLDFDQPWDIMNSLNKWMGILSDTILPTLRLLPIAKQDEIKHRIALYINNYERVSNGTASAASPSEE
jgi:dynein light intermediate chain 1